MLAESFHENSKLLTVPVINAGLIPEDSPFSEISVSIGFIHIVALGTALLAVPLCLLLLEKFWFGDHDNHYYEPFIDYAREEVLSNPYTGANFNGEKNDQENAEKENFLFSTSQKIYEIRDEIRNEILYYLNLLSNVVSHLSKKTQSLPLSRVRKTSSSVESGNHESSYQNPHYDAHWTRSSDEPLYYGQNA